MWPGAAFKSLARIFLRNFGKELPNKRIGNAGKSPDVKPDTLSACGRVVVATIRVFSRVPDPFVRKLLTKIAEKYARE